ncbi:hypothetical protein CAXC1_200012 [Candidatus Xenohaliotis californiensis]|uniref:Uncharacterized protein n=1 Tax=Candidatus Xenohaliotis californiensis TaxID=84677 RepID=A0ABP0ESA4_9RICK|nr:hypothetical protein CAXC1_200012 [Candidatus Xenohaliotis californiensis]
MKKFLILYILHQCSLSNPSSTTHSVKIIETLLAILKTNDYWL